MIFFKVTDHSSTPPLSDAVWVMRYESWQEPLKHLCAKTSDFTGDQSKLVPWCGRFRIGFWFDELALNSVSFSLILVRSRTCHTVGQSDSSILAKKWIYINMESIFLNFSWSFMVHHRSTVPYRPRIPIWIILKREFCEKTRKKSIFELDLREKETTRDEL